MSIADKDTLIDQYKVIHAQQAYGNTSGKNVPYVRPWLRQLRPRTVLDYGCGQSDLEKDFVPVGVKTFVKYDPAIPHLSEKPHGTFDCLLCTDVLEHIEERDLPAVIGEIRRYAPHAVLIVDTVLARQKLPDGRNAHVTVKSKKWWQAEFQKHYDVVVPIRVRSRRRAAFVTWKVSPADRLAITLDTAREVLRYRINKLIKRT